MLILRRRGRSSKEKEKEKNTIVGVDATRRKRDNDFIGKYNRSYVHCKEKDGHVYAKFIGSPYESVEWSL